MLEPLRPGQVKLRPGQFVPPFLASLIAAAAEGRDLLPYVASVTAHLGLDSFMYASAMPKSDHEEKAYVSLKLDISSRAVQFHFDSIPASWARRIGRKPSHLAYKRGSFGPGSARFATRDTCTKLQAWSSCGIPPIQSTPRVTATIRFSFEAAAAKRQGGMISSAEVATPLACALSHDQR